MSPIRASLVALAALAVGCSTPDSPGPSEGSAATEAAAQPARRTDNVTLTIVAMNDFHGGLYEKPHPKDPSLAAGGLPWLVGAVDELRKEAPELLLLDGGDVFQGSWPVNATKGRGAVDALNLLGVDAAAVGNHEFDYGVAGDGSHPLRGALMNGAKRANFAWLAANIEEVQPDGSTVRWEPEGIASWTMIEKKGLKIAVVGLATQDTPQTTTFTHVEDLRFTDVVAAVKRVLPEIEAAKPDVTALVAHLTGKCNPRGYYELGEPCLPGAEFGELLTELPKGTFDVMVTGHTHTLMAHRHDDTFLLQNRAYGHALGRLDLVVTPDGVDLDASTLHPPWAIQHKAVDPGCGEGTYDLSPQEVGNLRAPEGADVVMRTVTPSKEALDLVKALEDEVGSLCAPAGCTGEALTRDYDAASPLGSVVADAMAGLFPEADVAFVNSGGLRSDLPGGALRREDIQAVMPFDNKPMLLEVPGDKLLEAFRIGASGAHGVLQVAGGTYHFDPSLNNGTDRDGDGAIADWERDRLCSVTIGGQPIDPAKTYKVATIDFLVSGGDHMGPALSDAKVLAEGPLLREHLYGWFGGQGSCVVPPADIATTRVVVGRCDG